MATFKYLKSTQEEDVLIVTINHPPANTLSTKLMSELEQLLEEYELNKEVKVMILTGEGAIAFVAGADIREIIKINDKKTGEAMARRGQVILSRLENLDKPVIAAINGVCLGGGNELAMACHIRIASDKARFGQPEINLGIIPGFGGTQRLTRICGAAKACELNLTGDIISSQEALRIGLVNQVVPDSDLMKHSLGMARKIASKSAGSISLILQAMREGMESSTEKGFSKEAELFGEVCETKDMKEGLKAFVEKRQPQFVDE